MSIDKFKSTLNLRPATESESSDSAASRNNPHKNTEVPVSTDQTVASSTILSDDANGDGTGRLELIVPIYETDRDFRDRALAEADRFVTNNFGYDRGILRWEAIRIDADDLLVKDFANQDAIAKEFHISLFSDISFKATETKYSPQKANNMAVWKGVLDDGASGTIQMTIMKGTDRTSLLIRIHGPAGDFFITETEVPHVYVAAQADPTWHPNVSVN